MKLMEVTLGADIAVRLEDPSFLRSIFAYVDGELNPDEVFRACNRIESLEADLDGLAHAWQRQLRRQLDELECPSMSVGDGFEIDFVASWTCLPRGWLVSPCR